MIGHNFTGVSLIFTGDIAQGRVHIDRAIALYNPAEAADYARRFGVDIRVSTLCYRALALWMLGYPDAALRDAAQALSVAREIGHAAVLMFALGNTPRTYVQSGKYAAASALANELISLADEKDASLWKAAGMMVQGGLFVLTGKAADAVETITSGITAWRCTGATAGIPQTLSNLARAYGQLGQLDDAWRCIDEAMTTVESHCRRNRADGSAERLRESGNVLGARTRRRAATTSEILGTPRLYEPRTALARPGQGRASARTALRFTGGLRRASTRAI
jgi:tetratricopeptide (TPR) repeat protein